MDDQSESISPDPRINQLVGQLGKTTQALNNQVFFARVLDLEKEALATDPPKPKAADKHTPYPVVLVQIGGKDEKDHVRVWLPWLVNKAGADFQWWQPQSNEQVLVVAPSGNWTQAIIVGSVYRKGALGFDAQAQTRVQVTDDFMKQYGRQHSTWYQDGTQLRYDPLNHEYDFSLKDNWDAQHPLLTATWKLNADKKPMCALALYDQEHSIAQLTMDGSDAAKGQVTLRSGQANNAYSMVLDAHKKHIKITAGDLDAKYNLLMDNEQGKIQLQIADTHIVINKQGEVVINSKSAQLHADEQIILSSKKIQINGNTTVKGTLDVVE